MGKGTDRDSMGVAMISGTRADEDRKLNLHYTSKRDSFQNVTL
jgi:hypothetical protein